MGHKKIQVGDGKAVPLEQRGTNLVHLQHCIFKDLRAFLMHVM